MCDYYESAEDIVISKERAKKEVEQRFAESKDGFPYLSDLFGSDWNSKPRYNNYKLNAYDALDRVYGEE